MKKMTILLIAILFLVVGYAAYNTTINIYGNGKLAENLSDFKVYLSNLKVNGKEIDGINSTKDEFTIENINGNINVDIVNDSTEYDTEAYLECTKEDENVGKSWTFDYTGGEQTFTVLKTGTYKLEVWGAQGGTVDVSYYGGYGGYSTGTINQTKGNIMYVNVGGKGTGATKTGESLTGGYNGGGNVTGSETVNHMTASGGGATHIASISGLLSTLENNKSNIFIVSGGGGGGRNQENHSEAARWGFGGSGGGMNGGGPKSSLESTTSYTVVSSLAGTQTSGYAFGQGESVSIQSAGGGGFYGGYSGSNERSPYTGSGAGGSGYIGNNLLTDKSMYCYECTESDETSNKTISTTCTNSEPTENCAKIGNGYAKITLMSSLSNVTTDKITISAQESTSQNLKNITGKTLTCKLKVNKISRTEKKEYTGPTEWTFDYTGGEQIFTAPTTGTYKLETWGAQGGGVNDSSNSTSVNGGFGSYSIGNVEINKNQILYINVGGQGTNDCFEDSSDTSLCLGGYNGGGYGRGANSTAGSSSGGGATHIATSSGILSSLENKKSSILIVSGGGGGSGYAYGATYDGTTNTEYVRVDGTGGSGGGYAGNTGLDDWGIAYKGSNLFGFLGTGATQESAGKTMNYGEILNNASGSFGQGGNQYQNCCGGAGGGGGYFGGGGSSRCHAGGGGGSGYIGNSLLTDKAMYCYNCQESSEESTKTISTTCVSKTPTENCAKIGNGYARITFISRN